VAESLLKEGRADFIAMGRASIADPHLPNKVKEGRLDEILPCIGCWQGCQGKIAKQEPVACVVNPRTGKENQYVITPATKKKKVLVIGGGTAGMEAALVAAKRGHAVTLLEKSDRLGGQWLLAAMPPGKEMYNAFTVWQKNELVRNGVTVRLNTEATADLVRQEQADEIIYAAGASPFVPPIPGHDKAHVCTANDVLSGKVDLAGDVVVIGGGMVGAETAEHIAVHNHKVTIVEMLPAISPEMVSAPRHFLMKSLKDYEVDMYVNTKVLAIENQGILVETNGEKKFIPADLVVLATGSHANVALAEELKKEFPITMIGDTIHVGKAPDGIDEAYRLALTL
jgi:NADPH-dependent 2,4-dienoyl-CoA reductase/sulfur reductase-like enzyme